MAGGGAADIAIGCGTRVRTSGNRALARRALWVIGAGDMAGVARHVLDVAMNGVSGWELEFVLPPGPLAGRLREQGAIVHAARFGPTAGVGRSLGTLVLLARTRRYGIVHSHLAWADLLVATGVVRGAARVSTEHGIADVALLYQSTHAHATLMRFLHGVRMRCTHGVIAVSNATAIAMERLWKHPRSHTIVVPNGIDRDIETSFREGCRFGFIGRLSREKDPMTIIRAFEYVLGIIPQATLLIAGEGPLEGVLREEITRRGWRDSVLLHGWMPAEDFFEQIDVLVQLSSWENCSYSLLEAVARGLGIVATAVGGNSEILPQRCLVPAGDPWVAAQCMVAQARESWPRTTLPSGWPTVREMCNGIAAVYEDVLSSRSVSE